MMTQPFVDPTGTIEALVTSQRIGPSDALPLVGVAIPAGNVASRKLRQAKAGSLVLPNNKRPAGFFLVTNIGPEPQEGWRLPVAHGDIVCAPDFSGQPFENPLTGEFSFFVNVQGEAYAVIQRGSDVHERIMSTHVVDSGRGDAL